MYVVLVTIDIHRDRIVSFGSMYFFTTIYIRQMSYTLAYTMQCYFITHLIFRILHQVAESTKYDDLYTSNILLSISFPFIQVVLYHS